MISENESDIADKRIKKKLKFKRIISESLPIFNRKVRAFKKEKKEEEVNEDEKSESNS